MLYNYLKLFHILSAVFLLVSMVHSFSLWKKIQNGKQAILLSQRIQAQTVYFVIPCAIMQLATGITMISLQQDGFSQWWISISVIGFIVVIGSWLSFIYFLLMSQQLPADKKNNYPFYRRAQTLMLFVCAIAVLGLIFLMANQTQYVNHP